MIVESTVRFSRPCQDRGRLVLGKIGPKILILQSTMSALDRVVVDPMIMTTSKVVSTFGRVGGRFS